MSADQTYLDLTRDGDPEVMILHGDRIAIGRAQDNEVCFPTDETVSGAHAVLERRSGQWYLQDDGSTNGTYLNGQQLVDSRALRSGDEITIGRQRLIFRRPTEPDRPGPPLATTRSLDLNEQRNRPDESAPLDQFLESLSEGGIVGDFSTKLTSLRSHQWFSDENYQQVVKWCAAALAVSGSRQQTDAGYLVVRSLITAVEDAYDNDRALHAASCLAPSPAPEKVDRTQVPGEHAATDGHRWEELRWPPSSPIPIEVILLVGEIIVRAQPDEFVVGLYPSGGVASTPGLHLADVTPDRSAPPSSIVYALYGSWAIKVAEWESA